MAYAAWCTFLERACGCRAGVEAAEDLVTGDGVPTGGECFGRWGGGRGRDESEKQCGDERKGLHCGGIGLSFGWMGRS